MAWAHITANVINDFNPSLKMTQVHLKKKSCQHACSVHFGKRKPVAHHKLHGKYIAEITTNYFYYIV